MRGTEQNRFESPFSTRFRGPGFAGFSQT